ncbi:MAG: hypothetical protein AB3N21_00400 [Ruegeria sp.]|uniref:hypothetical protein n=1 Tax=Ruegeria sp. TaxID=1879320 RepID=UPI00349E6202
MRAFEILWIVLFRFHWIARIWAILLILVNLAALLFLDTYYAKACLLAAAAGIAVMIAIYLKQGFVRLLGIGHVFWIPMLAWFAWDLPDASENHALFVWVVLLIAFNSISLVIDVLDVTRYLRGERAPFYRW